MKNKNTKLFYNIEIPKDSEFYPWMVRDLLTSARGIST